jgi:hypothetical protein
MIPAIPVRDSWADGGGVILPGVTADGSPNTKKLLITSNNSFMNLNQSSSMTYVEAKENCLFHIRCQKKMTTK